MIASSGKISTNSPTHQILPTVQAIGLYSVYRTTRKLYWTIVYRYVITNVGKAMTKVKVKIQCL